MTGKLDLQKLHDRGLIPGTAESEEAFVRRAQAQSEHSGYIIPRFGIRVDWVPIAVSSDVRAWEAGYTEITEEESVRQARIALASKIPRFISLQEVIAHELVHALRVGFDDSKFEEFFAYATSSSPFRRVIGPLFRTPIVVYSVFIAAILGVALAWSVALPWWVSASIPVLPLCVQALFVYRDWWVLRRALRRIRSLFQGDPLAVALHLSDEEIALFARKPSVECKAYAKSHLSLRWKQLRMVYPLHSSSIAT